MFTHWSFIIICNTPGGCHAWWGMAAFVVGLVPLMVGGEAPMPGVAPLVVGTPKFVTQNSIFSIFGLSEVLETQTISRTTRCIGANRYLPGGSLSRNFSLQNLGHSLPRAWQILSSFRFGDTIHVYVGTMGRRKYSLKEILSS